MHSFRLYGVLIWSFALNMGVASAQSTLSYEHIGTSDNGEVFRVYATPPAGSLEISAVFGDSQHPIHLIADSGFFNASDGIDLADEPFENSEMVELDSWFTIGAIPGEFDGTIQSIGLEQSFLTFNNGGEFQANSEAGGMWFCYPGSTTSNDPDEDGRVLIAQLVSESLISLTLNYQYKNEEGDAANVLDDYLSIGVIGCQDSDACNYNSDASFQGTCTYAIAGYDCNGSCLNDIDGDGVCDDFEVDGCTDSLACNYSLAATQDDGSCVYALQGFECNSTVGFSHELIATNEFGLVYNIYAVLPPEAIALAAVFGSEDNPLNISSSEPFHQLMDGVDFADEELLGDLDYNDIQATDSWLTLGFVPESGDNANIIPVGIDEDDDFFINGGDLVFDSPEGEMWFFMPNDYSTGVPDENSQVLIAQLVTFGDISIQGNFQFVDEASNSIQVTGAALEIETTYFPTGPGCIDATACNYNPLATEDDQSCQFAQTFYDCDGICLNDLDGDGICDEFEIIGCTASSACNYDSTATDDSGECTYPTLGYDCFGNCLVDSDQDGVCDIFEIEGCTDEEACNFNGLATDQNGTCTYIGDDCDDGDDMTYADSLTTTCLCEGINVIFGCTDDSACNFNELANTDDGSCATIDECGICGGPGAVLDCGCEPIPEGDCDCFGNVLENGGCGLGCTYPFAENYDPEATTNDFTCIYDLVDLIESGACISSLLDGGLDVEDLLGLTLFDGGVGDVKLVWIDLDASQSHYVASDLGESSWVYGEDCYSLEIGGTSADFGSGPANTAAIVASGCALNPTDNDAAAMLCYNYSGFNADDWYLPSANEAVLFAEYGPGNNAVWTSTEDGAQFAMRYENGLVARYKNYSGYVYPSRSIDLSEDWYGNSCISNFNYGCADSTACNYGPEVTINDGSCEYSDEFYNCDGSCLNDADTDGICDELETEGCVDSEACNYSPGSTLDDGSCAYPAYGFTCDGDCLLDSDNDGICDQDEVTGCQDLTACNYDESATNSGYCDYAATNYDCQGNCLNDADADGVCDEFEIAGCSDDLACNFLSVATDNDGSCLYVDACGICGGDDTSCDDVCSNQEDEVAALGGCANAVFLLGCETLWNGIPLNEICPETCQSCPCESDFNENGVCDEDEVFGCTYPSACNFNTLATTDDGSCLYPVPGYDCSGEGLIIGCMDDASCSFSSSATSNDQTLCYYPLSGYDCDGNCLSDTDDDGICDEEEVAGCTDSMACNYDASATDDDGSCAYADAGYDCAGNCLLDTDNDQICDQDEITGCQDSTACNYNEAATDAGYCDYPETNYDCSGNCLNDADQDGICEEFEVEGCTDCEACNFATDATDDDGSCGYATAGFDCDGNCLIDSDNDGICDQNEILGCTDPNAEAFSFQPLATEDDGSCIYCNIEIQLDVVTGDHNESGSGYAGVSIISGYPPFTYYWIGPAGFESNDEDIFGLSSGNYTLYAVDTFGCEAVLSLDIIDYGCDDSEACNYNPAVSGGGSCDYPITNYDCDGNCLNDADQDGLCDEEEVAGCIDSMACNYDASATDDDGSCAYAVIGDDCNGNCLFDADLDGICDQDEVWGCQDSTACNYDETATEAGYCDYADAGHDCAGACLNDADQDGLCDEEEVAGCTDSSACNYSSDATDDDASCTYAADGLDCSGACLVDSDGDGICDQDEVTGCIYLSACNFSPLSDVDDGSCFFPAPGMDCNGEWLEQCQGFNNCITDINDDGVTGTSDLLMLLSSYGLACDDTSE